MKVERYINVSNIHICIDRGNSIQHIHSYLQIYRYIINTGDFNKDNFIIVERLLEGLKLFKYTYIINNLLS